MYILEKQPKICSLLSFPMCINLKTVTNKLICLGEVEESKKSVTILYYVEKQSSYIWIRIAKDEMAQQDSGTKGMILWCLAESRSSTVGLLRHVNKSTNLIQSHIGSPCGTTVSSYLHHYPKWLWMFWMKQAFRLGEETFRSLTSLSTGLMHSS